ncbi:MAG: hypothetical protein KBC96_10235 [Armatimonadetes bacterium]|nr:hypothetical protein [Armatimonadota bacterium]
MAKNYIPVNDEVYEAWLINFVNILEVNLAAVGLVTDDLVPISEAKDDFITRLEAYGLQSGLARAASEAKKGSRKTSEEILRPLVRRINNHPGMTDQLRTLLGLRPQSIAQQATPIEEMVPEVFLESRVGVITIHWGPNPQQENRNGKPEGVKAGNIYRKRSDDEEYTLVASATKSPHYDYVTGPATDYTYVVRYRGTTAQDLSAPSAAETIAARGDLAA